MDTIDTFKHNAIVGSHLAQLFTIKIKRINDGVEKCQVYGKIHVKDALGSDLVVYEKEADESEWVCEGDTLCLAQPHRPIFASTDFFFNLDLKTANGNGFVKKSHLVNISGRHPSLSYESGGSDIEGETGQDSDIEEAMGEEDYDKCIGADVVGEMGVVTVYFCVLKVAAPARIRAKVEMCGGIDFVKVSGSLVAHYGKRFDYGKDNASECSQVVLFNKESDDPIMVDKNYEDYLFQTRVAVPAYSTLVLEAKFHCVYSNGEVGDITRREEFTAKHVQFIPPALKGNYCQIRLFALFIGPRHAGDGLSKSS